MKTNSTIITEAKTLTATVRRKDVIERRLAVAAIAYHAYPPAAQLLASSLDIDRLY